jgi:hypothetical protein
MNRVFDYNGSIVAPSNPVKKLRTVKKTLIIDSSDRDVLKYSTNGDYVVYLPRVYENVVSLRLIGAEFPVFSTATLVPASADSPLYFLIDIEGLNKADECSVGADRSGYPDGHFAKIAVSADSALPTLYNDKNQQDNIARYSPAIGKLDRMHIRTRLHSQKANGGYIHWSSSNYSLTFDIEYLDNAFDEFSTFETRLFERA